MAPDKRLIVIFILQLISSLSACSQLHALAVLNLQKQYVRRTLNITRLLVFTSSNTRVKRLSPEKSKASLFAFFTADVSFSFLFAFDMLNYTITFGAWNLRANCRHVKSYCRLSLFQHAHYTNHWSQRFLSLSCGRVNAIQKRSCGRKYFDAFSVKWKRIVLKTHTCGRGHTSI